MRNNFLDAFNTVYIDDNEEDKENSYNNASYIDGPLPEDKKLFIATQGPISTTVETFWKMILNKKVKLIIMLTKLVEDNRVSVMNLSLA
jgi:protein tyrosine phosphatase